MSDIKAGDVIWGPRWPEPVEVKLVEEMGEYVHLVGATTGSGKHVDQLIPREELAQLQTDLDVYPTTHGPSALDNDSASACHPIGELSLSVRAYNCLARVGIYTIEALLSMSLDEVAEIPNVGLKTLAEIQEKLQVYLSTNPTPVTRVGATKTETPLSELDLPYWFQKKLRAEGFRSVEEMVACSEEELLLRLDVECNRYILPLKQALSERGLTLAIKSAVRPLADVDTLTALHERGVPLGEISIARLALPKAWEEALEGTGVDNVQKLATTSEVVLRTVRFPWHSDRVSEIKARLGRYLSWLLQQNSCESEVSGQGISPIYLIELSETSLEEMIRKLLASLNSDRQRAVLTLRYGLDGGGVKTLEEVGQLLGITRERVRQIQRRAIKLLIHPVRRRTIKAFVEFLQYAFIQSGGLFTKEQIAKIVESYMGIGDIDRCGAVCLIMEIDGRFVNLKKERVWGLDGYPLKHVSDVSRLMEKLLEVAHAPLSKADLLARFKSEKFYNKNKKELIDEFLVACLNTNSNMEILDDEYYGLKKWARSRIDEIVMVLRALGRPAHYTEIARLTNELLPASMRASDHVIHAQLQRESDIFVWVGRGTYGLKEWGLERPSYYADIIAEVLEGEGHPLPASEIFKQVNEIRPVKESTVTMTLTMHPHFKQFGGETYGLRSWGLPGEDMEERSLPADFLEDVKHRIFQKLIE